MVATRSRITGDDRAPSDHVSDPPLPPPHFYHNPHQGLKEKMKALTAMYEQHKIKTHRTSITDLPVPDSTRKKRSRGLEDEESAMRENIKPDFEAKENRIAVLSCPKKVMVPRKLSLGSPSVIRKLGGELGVIPEKGEAGSRIMVFVRLRSTSKKEKEAGSRSCVKNMNKKDVYLTEFASETDYLRPKRLCGRHFCFDTAFPDPTSQYLSFRTGGECTAKEEWFSVLLWGNESWQDIYYVGNGGEPRVDGAGHQGTLC